MPTATSWATTHLIQPGYGYWDTTRYPIGGDFHRVPRSGAPLPVMALRDAPESTSYGYMCEFQTADGRTLWADESAFTPDE